MKAKDFKLLDENGKHHTLSDYKGKWLVLYFYPKDDTPGCTIEACGLRDKLHELQSFGVEVVGVSKDSVQSHKKFIEKYHLNFPILSDESKSVIMKYKSWGVKKFMGREFEGTIRNTYLINPKGKVEKFYEKVNPLSHSSEILKYLTSRLKV